MVQLYVYLSKMERFWEINFYPLMGIIIGAENFLTSLRLFVEKFLLRSRRAPRDYTKTPKSLKIHKRHRNFHESCFWYLVLLCTELFLVCSRENQLGTRERVSGMPLRTRIAKQNLPSLCRHPTGENTQEICRSVLGVDMQTRTIDIHDRLCSRVWRGGSQELQTRWLWVESSTA